MIFWNEMVEFFSDFAENIAELLIEKGADVNIVGNEGSVSMMESFIYF